MAKRAPGMFAAIHVGSEQISMQIVEYLGLDSIRTVERVSRDVLLGEETFKTGRISFETVGAVCELLKGYRRVLNEYGVRDCRLIATTALREAKNQPYIIDQIRVKTGFDVEVIDMPTEIFYKYAAMFRSCERAGLLYGDAAVLFVDISSGGLGITLYEAGEIKYQQNIHIGVVRVKESFEKCQRETANFYQALVEYIYSSIEPVEQELRRRPVRYLVLSGLETRLLLGMLGRDPAERISVISPEEFNRLYAGIKDRTSAQIMKLFNLSEQKAEIVLPTLVLYQQILGLTTAERIAVPSDQLNDGIIDLYVAEKTGDPWLERLDEQIVSLARALAAKYKAEPRHAANVEHNALLPFDQLVRIHGLGQRERLLLKVAAILHDIGKFVSLRQHYFYSYRLIVSSDILGFSEEEKLVIANIAHYHSKGTPVDCDANFAMLAPAHKVIVAKLAAIIRLADALDRSHRGKAMGLDVALKGDEMVVGVTAKEDMSLEEWTFLDKAEFFKEVFGITPILKVREGVLTVNGRLSNVGI